MLISEIETWVRDFVRNGSDSSRYAADTIHRAIQSLAAAFISETTWITSSDIAIPAGTATLPSLAAAIALGFAPDRLRRARIVLAIPATTTSSDDPRLSITDFDQVYNRQINYQQTGMPQMIGFDTYSTGALWPTADQPYTLRLAWLATFNKWTAGSPLLLPVLSSGTISSIAVSTGGLTPYGTTPTVTITDPAGTGATATATLTDQKVTAINVTNAGTGYVSPRVLINGVDCTDQTLILPDDVLQDGILTDGARMKLQATEPENKALVAASTLAYKDFVMRMKSRGAGTLGGQISIRSSPRPTPRRRIISGWFRG